MLAGTLACAQAYPTKPIRLIVPFAPGGGTDIVARVLAQKLTESFGRTVIVDNRAGGGGTMGVETAVRATPDGYTVFLVNPANAINATLYTKLPFNFLKDLAPVGGMVRVPNVMEVTNSLPAKTIPEFIANAKANPGKVIMASSGAGTSVHLSGELFSSMARVKLVHVPYKGSAPAIIDVLSGAVPITFDLAATYYQHARAGRVRALAVSTARRFSQLPDVPTVAELGYPGFESNTWIGVFAPAGTPEEVLHRINAEINKLLASKSIADNFSSQSLEAVRMDRAATEAYVTAEARKWGAVVKETGARVD